MLRFRHTEERIYPGDGIFALGWSSSDPPVASDSMEEPMGAIEDDPCGRSWMPKKRPKRTNLARRQRDGKSIGLGSWLRLTLRSGGKTTTLPRAEALKMHRLGVAGALWIALIGALLLAGVLLMRYG